MPAARGRALHKDGACEEVMPWRKMGGEGEERGEKERREGEGRKRTDKTREERRRMIAVEQWKHDSSDAPLFILVVHLTIQSVLHLC